MSIMSVYGISFYDIFNNIANILIVFLFVFRNMFWLRISAVLCYICYITAQLLYAPDFGSPAFSIVFSRNVVIILINLIQITFIILEKKPIFMKKEIRHLYDTLFTFMYPREFLHFFDLGKRTSITNAHLYRQGEEGNFISLIIDGHVTIVKDQEEVAHLGAGSFLGEMSYISKQPISADVVAPNYVEVVAWNRETLERLKLKKPNTYVKFLSILGVDLIHKVQQGHHLK